MDLREYATALRLQWLSVVVAAVLGLGFGAVYSFLATPKYQASTQLFISVHSTGDAVDDLVQGTLFSQRVVESYADVVKTGAVLDPVIEQLGLDDSTGELAHKVFAVAREDSALIDITVTYTSAKLAADTADAVGESLGRVVQNDLESGAGKVPGLVSLTTTQTAIEPVFPASPRWALNMILGLVAGLFYGLAAALIRNSLDSRFHTLRELESASPLPILGVIPAADNEQASPSILPSLPRNPRAESFRYLRTNVQFLDVSQSGKAFVVTPANSGQEDSTLAAELALAIAETGQRVALVDGDLRSPQLHEYLGFENGPGLGDVLVGDADVDDVFERWGRTSLYFLPAGSAQPNPSELLGSDAMDGLLAELSSSFDVVMIDSPPINTVTDAAVVGHDRTKVLLVVAAGSTTHQAFEASLSALDNAGVEIGGVVMTKANAKASKKYGSTSPMAELNPGLSAGRKAL